MTASSWSFNDSEKKACVTKSEAITCLQIALNKSWTSNIQKKNEIVNKKNIEIIQKKHDEITIENEEDKNVIKEKKDDDLENY